MRAVWITRIGGPEVLAVRETPSPLPGPGEILVRVRASSVGFAEVMARQGTYPLAPKPPCIVGYDASGIVEAHGTGVNAPPIGARVMVICHFGAQAEMVVAPARFALPIPEDLSFEEAACIPWNYLVAYHLIFRVARVQPGERVLVHMAAGGVGMAAVQLLRTIADTTTFGTASSSKHDVLRAEGCQHAIDYHRLDYVNEVKKLTHGQGLDVVLDPLGGNDWRKGYDLLRPAGRLVTFGVANMMTGERRNLAAMLRQVLRTPRFSPFNLIEMNRSVAGVSTGRFWSDPQLLVESLTAAVEFCRRNNLHPHVDSVHPFDQIASAHQRIESRSNIGKVVLVP